MERRVGLVKRRRNVLRNKSNPPEQPPPFPVASGAFPHLHDEEGEDSRENNGQYSRREQQR